MSSKCLLILTALAAGTAQAGLVHSYDFTSGVTDLTGTENGSLVGGASVGGGALVLNGNGYAEFLTHLIPTSGSYSVVLDFRLAGAQSGIHELISQGSSGAGFYIGSSNSTDFRVTDSWGSSGVPFPTDTLWHQIALVVDATGGGTSTFYLDGTQMGLLGSAIATTTGGSDTRLGGQFGPHGEYFSGEIDNVRIYDSAITSGELAGTPEPSTFLLLAFGAGSLALTRRRRV